MSEVVQVTLTGRFASLRVAGCHHTALCTALLQGATILPYALPCCRVPPYCLMHTAALRYPLTHRSYPCLFAHLCSQLTHTAVLCALT